jgi:hypothetical protein
VIGDSDHEKMKLRQGRVTGKPEGFLNWRKQGKSRFRSNSAWKRDLAIMRSLRSGTREAQIV